MRKKDVAEYMVRRLNMLIEDPAIANDIERLICQRISVSEKTAKHPALLTAPGLGFRGGCGLGLLGVLNGICGVSKQGSEYVVAQYRGNPSKLHSFVRRADK